MPGFMTGLGGVKLICCRLKIRLLGSPVLPCLLSIHTMTGCMDDLFTKQISLFNHRFSPNAILSDMHESHEFDSIIVSYTVSPDWSLTPMPYMDLFKPFNFLLACEMSRISTGSI